VNELQLQTGPYRTTFIGTEITRQSTKDEWENYGEILRRVDEAKQWAIGDWLVDGKRHYGDGVYEKAAKVLGYQEQSLKQFKGMASLYGDQKFRRLNLSWAHHQEVASLKTIEETEDGKLELSGGTDYEKIEELLSKAEKESLSVRDLREEVRKHKEQQREYIRLANEPEKYSVIYADPPWRYDAGDQHTFEEQETVKDTHYSDMTFDEICQVPVSQMACNDCVLFLWVPAPLNERAFQIVKAWGFEYKAQMVWDKVKHNVGHHVSVRHELLFLCHRGIPPKVPKLVDSVYVEERTEHSKKPAYFRQLIDELFPIGKRIELFARGNIPEHWDRWGNE